MRRPLTGRPECEGTRSAQGWCWHPRWPAATAACSSTQGHSEGHARHPRSGHRAAHACGSAHGRPGLLRQSRAGTGPPTAPGAPPPRSSLPPLAETAPSVAPGAPDGQVGFLPDERACEPSTQWGRGRYPSHPAALGLTHTHARRRPFPSAGAADALAERWDTRLHSPSGCPGPRAGGGAAGGQSRPDTGIQPPPLAQRGSAAAVLRRKGSSCPPEQWQGAPPRGELRGEVAAPDAPETRAEGPPAEDTGVGVGLLPWARCAWPSAGDGRPAGAAPRGWRVRTRPQDQGLSWPSTSFGDAR